MKTKEEIQAQIDLLNDIVEFKNSLPDKNGNIELRLLNINVTIQGLLFKLIKAKSIKDLEEKAFDAGREADRIIWQNQKYLRFTDYLKSKK